MAAHTIKVFNAVTADTTYELECSDHNAILFHVITSNTALLHGSIRVDLSYDGGKNYIPVSALSVTRNLQYAWWVNCAGATHAQITYDEIVATAGTCTLYATISHNNLNDVALLPPVTLNFREELTLTGSYVSTNELVVSNFRYLTIVGDFLTGTTGLSDVWLPEFMIEVSPVMTVTDDWAVLDAESLSSGLLTLKNMTIRANNGSNYTVAATTYKDLIASFENHSWQRMRVKVKETQTPTNHGKQTIRLMARS